MLGEIFAKPAPNDRQDYVVDGCTLQPILDRANIGELENRSVPNAVRRTFAIGSTKIPRSTKANSVAEIYQQILKSMLSQHPKRIENPMTWSGAFQKIWSEINYSDWYCEVRQF